MSAALPVPGSSPSISTLPYSDKSRWQTIYPIYLNRAKKQSEGRRVPLSKSVDRPSVIDLGEICLQLRLPYLIEGNKCYCRDYTQRGRIRVQLKQSDGTAYNANIHNKNQFLLYAGENIPKLKNYNSRVEAAIKAEKEELAMFLPQAAQQQAREEKKNEEAGGGNTSGKKKKKGKK